MIAKKNGEATNSLKNLMKIDTKTKITLTRNNKVDGDFEITIDEVVRGYIKSEYYQDYIVARGMPLYIIYFLNASYEHLSDNDLLIDYYLANRDRLAEELGKTS